MLGGGRSERFEPFERIVQRVQTGAPPLVGKWRIGDDIVEGFEGVALLEFGIYQRIALHDQRLCIVVQDHVHPREAAGGGVLLLPVERDSGGCLVADLEQQGTRSAGGIVDGGGGAGLGVMDTDDLSNDGG